MIVSASYRTDIPAFYGAWFRERLAAGCAEVRNPYGGPPYRVDLTPQGAAGFVFWTRNAAPFSETLTGLAADRRPFAVQYTVLGYPRALDAAVPAPDQAVATIHRLCEQFGPRAVVWRYDPILFSDLTPVDWHLNSFASLASALAGAVDEVTISFAEIYAKTARNLRVAARAHRFDWHDPGIETKSALVMDLAAIAATHGMALTLCTQPKLVETLSHFAPEGVPDRITPKAAVCVDTERLSAVAVRFGTPPVAGRTKGNRPGCHCAESRDIGAYDTCPHGCVYCYAVRNRAIARAAYKAHKPDQAMLGATPGRAPATAIPA